MRILCIGDSLVRGTQGVSFVKQLARRHPEWQLVNAGVNGEPLLSIARRLRQRLAAGQVYDIVVLEAGANDLVLPCFASWGPGFAWALRQQRRAGHQPLETVEEFEHHYHATVQHLRAHSQARVVLLTLGCLNEKLDTALNDKRRQYNEAIRRVAAAHGCALADGGARLEAALPQPGRDYLMRSFFATALGDKIQCFLGRADALSRQRGLQLTIDGGHLNSRGAAIFAQALEEQLLKVAERPAAAVMPREHVR